MNIFKNITIYNAQCTQKLFFSSPGMDYVGQVRHFARGRSLVTMQTPCQTAGVTSFASIPPTQGDCSSIVRQVCNIIILLQIVNHHPPPGAVHCMRLNLIYDFQLKLTISTLYQEPSSPGPRRCVTTRRPSGAASRRKERIKTPALSSANKSRATTSYRRRTITSLGGNHRPWGMITAALKERS